MQQRLVVHLHPAARVLQLDVDLPEPEENQLLLLGTLGNLGSEGIRFSPAPHGLGWSLCPSHLGFESGIPLEQPGCPAALFPEVLDQIFPLVVQLL